MRWSGRKKKEGLSFRWATFIGATRQSRIPSHMSSSNSLRLRTGKPIISRSYFSKRSSLDFYSRTLYKVSEIAGQSFPQVYSSLPSSVSSIWDTSDVSISNWVTSCLSLLNLEYESKWCGWGSATWPSQKKNACSCGACLHFSCFLPQIWLLNALSSWNRMNTSSVRHFAWKWFPPSLSRRQWLAVSHQMDYHVVSHVESKNVDGKSDPFQL